MREKWKRQGSRSTWEGRKAGLEALEKFQVQGYAGTRNKLKGNVSRLSFYIRHGVLGIREVAESARERFGKSYDAVKFWQELGVAAVLATPVRGVGRRDL